VLTAASLSDVNFEEMVMVMNTLAGIYCGYMLDLIFGDPPWFPHPVRLIGAMIARTEAFLRRWCTSPSRERTCGVLLLLFIVGLAYGATFLLLHNAGKISSIAQLALAAFLTYTILATRCLGLEAREIAALLERHDLVGARKSLSRIVGRETEHLGEDEIVRAAVETVAENTVDGIVAPLFFIFLGGPALGMAYKAINTLDSMVGYRNVRYLHFGWASARFDDLVNFIPARLTGFLFLPLAALIAGHDALRSLTIVRRDRFKHKSPNSGHPEAAMAGALGVRLGGTNIYSGVPVEKPAIGDPLKALEIRDIIDAVKLMQLSSVASLLLLTLAWMALRIL
jgi:adenosylcobinamide-phosphate synthase